ncbi:MAG: hypothetical protein ABGW87_12690 [Sphingomonadaceae bacterium]
MSRKMIAAFLAGLMLTLFLGSKILDINFGYWGFGLLVIAAAFGLIALVTPETGATIDDEQAGWRSPLQKRLFYGALLLMLTVSLLPLIRAL